MEPTPKIVQHMRWGWETNLNISLASPRSYNELIPMEIQTSTNRSQQTDSESASNRLRELETFYRELLQLPSSHFSFCSSDF